MNNNPTPIEIKCARMEAGLTQTEAAHILGRSLRCWQYWESGGRKMSAVLFETFIQRVGA